MVGDASHAEMGPEQFSGHIADLRAQRTRESLFDLRPTAGLEVNCVALLFCRVNIRLEQ